MFNKILKNYLDIEIDTRLDSFVNDELDEVINENKDWFITNNHKDKGYGTTYNYKNKSDQEKIKFVDYLLSKQYYYSKYFESKDEVVFIYANSNEWTHFKKECDKWERWEKENTKSKDKER